jgi:hypothetical protein
MMDGRAGDFWPRHLGVFDLALPRRGSDPGRTVAFDWTVLRRTQPPRVDNHRFETIANRDAPEPRDVRSAVHVMDEEICHKMTGQQLSRGKQSLLKYFICHTQ